MANKELDDDVSRISEGDTVQGTASIYAATTTDLMPFIADFEVNTMLESDLEQTRARRKHFPKQGKKLAKSRSDQLKHELLVILGPDMSANDAVAALERVISSIKKNGLLIGRRRNDDEYVREAFGPDPRIV